MESVTETVDDVEVEKRPIKHIPKAPAQFNTIMTKVQRGDREEVRVERGLYDVLEDFKPTADWAQQRLRVSQKAREQLGGWT